MEDIIKRLNSMVVKGGACSCTLKDQTIRDENGKVVQQLVGGAKSKRAKLENMKVARLQKMAVSKGIKITKKKDGKTVYLKKATLVNKLLRK